MSHIVTVFLAVLNFTMKTVVCPLTLKQVLENIVVERVNTGNQHLLTMFFTT